jgi:hypothetical protein
MTKTAIGLFENSGSVDDVVRELEASGFSRNEVRVLSEPRDMGSSTVMSTPRTDFEVALTRDLTSFGVAEADAEAYVRGVRRGGIMVVASGSDSTADNAVAIMNRHGAVEITEIAASHSYLPGVNNDERTPDRDISFQAERFHTAGSGARLFVW